MKRLLAVLLVICTLLCFNTVAFAKDNNQNTVEHTADIEKKLEEQRNESDVVSELVRRCVENNAHTTVNPDEYSEQYIELVKRYEAAQEKIKKYSDELRERATKRDKITAYLKTLESQKVLITEFDETLWNLTVEKMVVYSKKEIVITFKDGETVQCQVT